MADDGLIHAFLLDGKGGARAADWQAVRRWSPSQGTLWIHIDYTHPAARHWLRAESGLDPVAAEALLSEATRPRATFFDDGALLALRGVNLNPDADPEDMVAIRLWVSPQRIISSRKRPLLSTSEIVEAFGLGKGPRNAGDYLVSLCSRLTARMEDTVDDLDERAARMEDAVVSAGRRRQSLRAELSGIRRVAIALRRYLAPQREAMIRLYSEQLPWLDRTQRIRLREVTDQLIRHIEDLDAIRERTAVTQEELINKLSEQMNARMYLLSLVAALFLPLSFFTGLFGVNLAGIPGAGHPWAFATLVALLLGVVLLEIVFYRRRRWL